jgi:hypothetical protein
MLLSALGSLSPLLLLRRSGGSHPKRRLEPGYQGNPHWISTSHLFLNDRVSKLFL